MFPSSVGLIFGSLKRRKDWLFHWRQLQDDSLVYGIVIIFMSPITCEYDEWKKNP